MNPETHRLGPVEPADPTGILPGPRPFPWATVVPFGVALAACLGRLILLYQRGEGWGGEPALMILVALVAALLIAVDVRKWLRNHSRLVQPRET